MAAQGTFTDVDLPNSSAIPRQIPIEPVAHRHVQQSQKSKRPWTKSTLNALKSTYCPHCNTTFRTPGLLTYVAPSYLPGFVLSLTSTAGTWRRSPGLFLVPTKTVPSGVSTSANFGAISPRTSTRTGPRRASSVPCRSASTLTRGSGGWIISSGTYATGTLVWRLEIALVTVWEGVARRIPGTALGMVRLVSTRLGMLMSGFESDAMLVAWCRTRTGIGASTVFISEFGVEEGRLGASPLSPLVYSR